jgi:hypothetical protein
MAEDTGRAPVPPFPLGPGFEWRPIVDPDPAVRLPTSAKRCRWTVGPGHRQCGRPAVFEMRRGDAGWWGYCVDQVEGRSRYGRRTPQRHGYGRWVENDQIMIWAQRRKAEQ